MALLSNQSYIVPTVMIDLTFEDTVRKVFPVACKDVIRVVYNNKGLATIYLGTIIDCDMIYKWSDNYVVTTPPTDVIHDIKSVNMMRIKNGKLEISTNFGETWFVPDITQDSDSNEVDDEL